MKIKNKLKTKNLFLYVFLNSLYLFSYNFKIYKILIIFNYIWFLYILFIIKKNHFP